MGSNICICNTSWSPQLYVNYIWFGLDVIIVMQFLKYGKKEFPNISEWQFYAIFALGLSVAVPMILTINYEMNDSAGAYAAFGQNLMMSVLFVTMIINRKGVEGQSFYIALFKMVGTGLSSLAFYQFRPSTQDSILLPLLFVSIFVFDLIYTVAIYRKYRSTGYP